MIFTNDTFTPERIGDRRVREALCAVAERAGDTIHPGDILAAAIVLEHPSFQRLLSHCLRPDARTPQ